MSVDQSRSSIRLRLWRYARRHPLAMLAFSLTGTVVVATIVLDRSIAWSVQRRLARLRADGVPVTPTDLRRRCLQLNDDENMAVAVFDCGVALQDALARFGDEVRLLPVIGMHPLPQIGRSLPDDCRETAMRFETNSAAVVARLYAALALPRGQYDIVEPLRGSNRHMGYLAVHTWLARLLQMSFHLRIAMQDRQGAMKRIEDLVRLDEALSAPTDSSTIPVRLAARDRALSCIEAYLGIYQPTVVELDAMDRYLALWSDVDELLADALDVDRVRLLQTIARHYEGAATNDDLAIFDGFSFALRHLPAMSWCDKSAALNVIDDFHQAIAMEPAESLKSIDATLQRTAELPWYCPVTPLVSLSPQSAFAAADAYKARWAALQTVLKLERLRGGLPELPDLEVVEAELVRWHIRDPFEASLPLRLQYRDGMWIVYSVGPDQIDNGGDVWRSAARREDNADIGIRLLEPQRRNRGSTAAWQVSELEQAN